MRRMVRCSKAKRCVNISLVMLWLSFSCILQAAEAGPVQLHVAWLGDQDQHTTVENIALKPTQDFIPIPAQGISLGFRDDRIWLRMTLENTSPDDREGWLDMGTPRLASAVLYQRDNAGRWTALQTGLAVPAQQRALFNRGVVFPVRLKAFETRSVYLAIVSNTVITLQPDFWSPPAYREQQQQGELRDLLLFGATLGLAAFGLLQAFAARDIVLALNGLRALCVTVWSSLVMGYMTFYLWPQAPALLLPLINVLSAAFLAIQMLLVALFLPRGHYPNALRYAFFTVAVIALGVALAVARLDAVGQVLKALSFIGMLMQLGVFYACFITAWRGFYPAWWLLGGFSFAIFGFYRRLAEASGWIAPSSNVDFMALLNAFISTVFFYLGTAARVDKLRTEREQALEANVILQRETEQRLDQEVKQRTLELETARDEANRANQAKTLFLAKISHELRSPMHTILSYADLARRDKVLRHVDTIADAGQHLLNLIDDLLAYVKNSCADLHIDRRPHYTGRLAEQLQAYGATLAARRNNAFSLMADAGLPPCIEIDSRRVIQIGVALLSNAAVYTQNGRIELCLTQQGRHLQLQVQDNGSGIAAEHLERIFQPFERADNSNDTGLGLGLAIAQQLAKAMDGELFADSILGQGSTFTLRIPLIPADPAAIPAFDGAHDVVGYKGKVRRIIVVDDTPDHRRVMTESLEALGFEVLAAESGSALLDYANVSARCDLVLLDFHLAGTTADSVMPQLRRLAGWESVPVILISASPPEHTHGFAAVVSKPATYNKILTTIADVLDVEWRYAPPAGSTESEASPWSAADWENALDAGDVFAVETCIEHLAQHHPQLAEQARRDLENYDFAAIRQQLAAHLTPA